MAHRLLLADDSVTIQRVIELTFADQDVDVTVVGNGREAIDSLHTSRPDIVLADIGMPLHDGYEVAEFIKGHPELAHIPVVLLTGAFEPIDEDRARAVGCDAVLVKPFEPQMVIDRVKALLARARPGARPAADPEPQRSPGSDVPPPQGSRGESVDAYFDRLDQAFAKLGSGGPRVPAADEDVTRTLREPSDAPQPRAAAGDPLTAWDPDVSGGLAPSAQPHLASAFAALLAAEQGQGSPAAAVPPVFSLPDELLDEIVRRVLARMSDDSMRKLVLDAAERLVREEIERIKAS